MSRNGLRNLSVVFMRVFRSGMFSLLKISSSSFEYSMGTSNPSSFPRWYRKTRSDFINKSYNGSPFIVGRCISNLVVMGRKLFRRIIPIFFLSSSYSGKALVGIIAPAFLTFFITSSGIGSMRIDTTLSFISYVKEYILGSTSDITTSYNQIRLIKQKLAKRWPGLLDRILSWFRRWRG